MRRFEVMVFVGLLFSVLACEPGSDAVGSVTEAIHAGGPYRMTGAGRLGRGGTYRFDSLAG